MKEYIVKSEKGRKYRLFDGVRELGLLSYSKWFSMNSEIEFSDYKKLSVISTGFWNNRMIIKNNDFEVASFKMTFKGGILITTKSKVYRLKPKGIFKSGFVLTDETNETLLTADYRLIWKAMTNDFTFVSSEAFEGISDKETLLMIVLAAANYYIAVMASAAA
jgi:hypothetical protein